MNENATCRWVDDNLQAYLFDDLEPDMRRRIDDHARSCTACAGEIEDHRRVEHLVQALYRERLETAMGARSRSARAGWIPGGIWMGAAGAAAAVVLAAGLLMWMPTATSDVADTGGASPEKTEETAVERAKPAEADESPELRAIDTEASESPQFALEDPAGYLMTLEDFSGSALVIGVLDENSGDAFRDTYERFRDTDGLRFIAVPAGTDELPSGLPSMRSRGDVLDTPPGGFVLVGPDGRVNGRGLIGDPVFGESVERWIEADFTAVRDE